MIGVRLIKLGVFAGAFLFSSGCGIDAGKTIAVDRAEVFTRERLVARRYAEQVWLEDQLKPDNMPSANDVQGLRDYREFDTFLTTVSATVNPLGGAIQGQQGKLAVEQLQNQREVADLQNEITSIQIREQLAELQRQIEAQKWKPTVPPEPTATNSSPAAGVTPEQLKATIAELETKLNETITQEVAKQQQTKTDPKTAVPDPGAAVASRAKPHPLDVLADKVAYRNAVHALLREQELDDTHDLLGQTIHTFKFDITVGGVNIKNAVAQVEFQVHNDTQEQKTHNKINKDDYNKLCQILEQRMAVEINNYARRLSAEMQIDFGKELALESQLLQARNLTRQTLGYLLKNSSGEIRKFLPDTFKNIPLEKQVNEDDLTKLQEVVDLGDRSSTELKPYRQWIEAQTRLVDIQSVRDDLAFEPNATNFDKSDVLFDAAKLIIESRYHILTKRGDPIFEFETHYVFTPKHLGALPLVMRALDDKDSRIDSLQAVLEREPQHAYVYAIEPHQQAQAISDVAALEKLRGLTLSIAALLPNTGVSGSAYTQWLNTSQQRVHALLRNPLVVGYASSLRKGKAENNSVIDSGLDRSVGHPQESVSSGKRDGAPDSKSDRYQNLNSFGWIFGGQFAIDRKGKAIFKHATKTHSVQASLAVPAWWSNVTFGVTRTWTNAKTGKARGTPATYDVDVNLPPDLGAILRFLTEKNGSLPRGPIISPPSLSYPWQVLADVAESQELVIRGNDLWRSPRVFLDGREADTVQILPDMKGLHITFSKVRMPVGANGDQATAPLLIVTSEGSDEYPVVIVRASQTRPQPFLSLVSPYVVKERSVIFRMLPDIAPKAYSAVQLVLTPAEAAPLGQPVRVVLGMDKYTSANVNTVEWKLVGTDAFGPNPRLVKGTTQVQFSPGGEWVDVSTGQFVYFPTEALALPEFKITPVTAGSNQQQPIDVTLTIEGAYVQLYFTAYPELGSAARLRLADGEAEIPVSFNEAGTATTNVTPLAITAGDSREVQPVVLWGKKSQPTQNKIKFTKPL